MFVINLAFEDENDKYLFNGRNTDERRSTVKRIEDISMILDNFSSQEFANAISLLSMANEGAAISSSYISKQLVATFVSSILNDNTEQNEANIKEEKIKSKIEETKEFETDGFTQEFENLDDTSFFD